MGDVYNDFVATDWANRSFAIFATMCFATSHLGPNFRVVSFISIGLFTLLFQKVEASRPHSEPNDRLLNRILDYNSRHQFDSTIFLYNELDDATVLRRIEIVRQLRQAYYNTNKAYPALKMLRAALEYANDFPLADQYWLYSEAATFAHECEILDESKYYLDRAYPMGVSLYGEKSGELAGLILDLGRAYSLMGNGYEANLYNRKASDIYRDLYGVNSPEYHLTIVKIALQTPVTELDEDGQKNLLSLLKKGVQLSKRYSDPNVGKLWKMKYNTMITKLFLDLNLPDSAWVYHIKGQQISIRNISTVGAQILLQQGKLDDAIVEMRNVFTEFAGYGYESTNRMADLLALRGDIHKARGNTDLAHQDYDSALVILTGMTSVDEGDIGSVNCHNLWPDESLYQILLKKIRLLGEEAASTASLPLQLQQLKYYHFVTNYVNGCLSRFVSQASKLYWAENTDEVYQGAIEAAAKLFNQTADDSFLVDALLFANKRKYRLVSEENNSVNISRQLSIPDSLRLKEIEFYKEIDKATKERNLPNLNLYTARLQSIHRVYEEEYSNFWCFKSDVLVSGDQRFLQRIAPDEALIQFTTFSDKLYILLYSKASKKIWTVDLAKIETLSRTYLEALHQRLPGWRHESHELFQMLLGPVVSELDDVHALIFVSDGLLSYIPFESLVVDNRQGRPGFLVEDYRVRYSLNMLWNRPPHHVELNSLSAFAPQSDLNFHVREVEEVASITQGQSWVGGEATVDHFRKESSSKDIIHLATHYQYDDGNFLNSYFSFGENSNDTNQLKMIDVMSFRLASDLVVLSACRTGVGLLAKGEGVMSVGRSFAYAGVPNLVMTLWDVPDQSTTDLMVSFYESLTTGISYDEALREAKLKFLKSADKNTMHPYFWASPIIIRNGEGAATKNENGFWVIAWVGVFLLVFGLGFWFVKTRKFSPWPFGPKLGKQI